MKHLLLGLAICLPSLSYAFEGETEASVSVSSVSARTSADLTTGIKEVACDAAVFYRMGTSTAVATTSDASRAATVRFYVNITNDGRRLAFITGGATGTCRIYPVNFLASSRAAVGLLMSSGGSVNGQAISPSSINSSGDITGYHFVSTADDSVSAYNLAEGITMCWDYPSCTALMSYSALRTPQLLATPSLGSSAALVAGAASSCSESISGGASSTALAASGTNCSTSLQPTGSGTTSVGTTSTGATTVGNATGGVTLQGPINLGGIVTGFVNLQSSATVVANTAIGAAQFTQNITGLKLRNVSCIHTTAGSGTAGTLAIRNVTDGTTLCSASYTCTTSANTPTSILDCNQTPLQNKQYSAMFTTGCGTLQVTGLNCNVEITR